jgi:sugar phosphate isomerase/epimerase
MQPFPQNQKARISRRSALFGATAALATTRLSASALFDTGRHPLGINLYMLEPDYRKDIDATLRAVAAIGFREVETNFDIHPPARIRAALDRTGLRCTAIGVLPTAMRGGEMSFATDTALLADAVHTVGAGYVVSTLFMLPDGVQLRPLPGEAIDAMLARITRSLDIDAWKRTADLLNRKGAELKRHGLRLAYHNHNPEFAPHGETNGLAILLDHTDPALVDFEMDAGWVVAAGHDPVALLRAYPGRFRLMHVKDIAAANIPNTVLKAVTTEVGSGIVDWRRVLTAARSSGVRHFAIEQEPPYAGPRLDAARKSFAYLEGLTA